MGAEAIDNRTQRLMAMGPRVDVLNHVLNFLHANWHDTAAAVGIDPEEAGKSLRALLRLGFLGRYPKIPGTPDNRRDYRITPKGIQMSLVLAAA